MTLRTGAGSIGTGTGANAINLGAGQSVAAYTNGSGSIFLTGAGALNLGEVFTAGGEVNVATTGSGTLTVGEGIGTLGGNVTLSSRDQLAVSSNITAGAGTVNLLANQDGAGVQGFVQSNGTTISGTGISIRVNTAG